MNATARLISVSLILTLAACGGGGDPVSPEQKNPPAQAPVASVQINGNSSASLVGGATRALSVSLFDAQGATLTGRSVSWATNNAGVATVSNSGVVTATGQGTAKITATSEGKSGSVDITVQLVPASIEIVRSSSFIVVGDTLQLSARVVDNGNRVVPGQQVTFTVGGPAATMTADGLLTAVAPATVTVTATSGNIVRTANIEVAAGGGARVSSLSVIDSLAIAERVRLNIPAVSIAIARNGQLLFARAYGYADTAIKRMANPAQMYRIGSTSKPLTAVAVMRLVQEGQLSLDSKPFVLLNEITPRPGFTEDPRLANITVRDLLQHSAGWNANRAVDDSVWYGATRDRVLDKLQLARYGRSVPLASNPGTSYGYTNYTYQVLGRLIEKVTGQSYETYVRNAVLTPAGVTEMQLGRTPLAMRLPQEVTCYDRTEQIVTGTYGTGKWCDVAPEFEYSEASGAWIASARDMVRWMSVVDGFSGNRPDILTSSTLNTMTARPAGNFWPGNGGFYALGWQVMPDATGQTWEHTGAIAGGDASITRLPNGVVVAILTNRTRNLASGAENLDAKLIQLIRSISTWPAGVDF